VARARVSRASLEGQNSTLGVEAARVRHFVRCAIEANVGKLKSERSQIVTEARVEDHASTMERRSSFFLLLEEGEAKGTALERSLELHGVVRRLKSAIEARVAIDAARDSHVTALGAVLNVRLRDSVALLDELRAICPNLPVIVCSGLEPAGVLTAFALAARAAAGLETALLARPGRRASGVGRIIATSDSEKDAAHMKIRLFVEAAMHSHGFKEAQADVLHAGLRRLPPGQLVGRTISYEGWKSQARAVKERFGYADENWDRLIADLLFEILG
jgi:hypothetical protein